MLKLHTFSHTHKHTWCTHRICGWGQKSNNKIITRSQPKRIGKTEQRRSEGKKNTQMQTLLRWSTGQKTMGKGERKRDRTNMLKRTRLKELHFVCTNRKTKKNTKENSKPLVCKVYKRRRVLALCHPTKFSQKPKFTTHTLLLLPCTNECIEEEW